MTPLEILAAATVASLLLALASGIALRLFVSRRRKATSSESESSWHTRAVWAARLTRGLGALFLAVLVATVGWFLAVTFAL